MSGFVGAQHECHDAAFVQGWADRFVPTPPRIAASVGPGGLDKLGAGVSRARSANKEDEPNDHLKLD